jgi:diguanylate cyclase (GGDEF)-like protein
VRQPNSLHPPLPSPEDLRVSCLESYDILDTAGEGAYDDVARLAGMLAGTPACGIGFVDGARWWGKAVVGFPVTELPRDDTFCSYAVSSGATLFVGDARSDLRFRGLGAVRSGAIVGYLGVPLRTSDGYCIGTLWAASAEPLPEDGAVRWGIEALAGQVVALLEERRRRRRLTELLEERERDRRRLAEETEVLVRLAEGADLPTVLAGLSAALDREVARALRAGDDATARGAAAPRRAPRFVRSEVLRGPVPAGDVGLPVRVSLPLRSTRDGVGLGALVLRSATSLPDDAATWPSVQRAAALASIALDRHRLDEDLTRRAAQDELTGLPNRRALRRHLGGRIAARAPVGVLFCDLDDFKLLNDSLGHAAGDAYLRGLAARLRDAAGSADLVGRFGGDEFIVVVEGASDLADLRSSASRVPPPPAAPIEVDGRAVRLTVSIGGAIAGPDGDADALLRDADAAMYRAKGRGGGCLVAADAATHAEALAQLDTVADLRAGLQRDELCVAYQPIVDLRDGSIRHVEALVRWAHPTRGVLGPASFLPVAEQAGLAAAVDDAVLASVARQLRRWDGVAELAGVRVFVNLCADLLDAPDLAERTLRTSPAPASTRGDSASRSRRPRSATSTAPGRSRTSARSRKPASSWRWTTSGSAPRRSPACGTSPSTS